MHQIPIWFHSPSKIQLHCYTIRSLIHFVAPARDVCVCVCTKYVLIYDSKNQIAHTRSAQTENYTEFVVSSVFIWSTRNTIKFICMQTAHKNSTNATDLDKKRCTTNEAKQKWTHWERKGKKSATRSGKTQKVKTIKYYVLVRFETGTLFMCSMGACMSKWAVCERFFFASFLQLLLLLLCDSYSWNGRSDLHSAKQTLADGSKAVCVCSCCDCLPIAQTKQSSFCTQWMACKHVEVSQRMCVQCSAECTVEHNK